MFETVSECLGQLALVLYEVAHGGLPIFDQVTVLHPAAGWRNELRLVWVQLYTLVGHELLGSILRIKSLTALRAERSAGTAVVQVSCLFQLNFLNWGVAIGRLGVNNAFFFLN